MNPTTFPTLCAVLATFISLLTIYSHLHNYKKPTLQRYCIRVLFMVPIYAIASTLSLYSISHAEYIDTIRDVYEAFVIYSFFNLLVNFLGGERELLTILRQRMRSYHLWPFNICFGLVNLSDPETFLFIRRGVLQFVIVKPIISLLILILRIAHVYDEGSISYTSPYLWISFLYNISIFIAMYCLVLFYVQCRRDLEPLRPLPKYICIKAIIFFSFWQGLIISFLVGFNIIKSDNQHLPIYIQNYMICIESVGFAILHAYAFSYHDYDETRLSSRVALRYAIKDAFGLKDVIQDTYYTFFSQKYRPINTDVYGTDYDSDSFHVDDEDDVLLDVQEEDERVLKFDDEDESIERDYDYSRGLIFGDANFPVIPTDPRRADPSSALERLQRQQERTVHYEERPENSFTILDT